jgi:hypothetical protein
MSQHITYHNRNDCIYRVELVYLYATERLIHRDSSKYV